jgi:uncharacterized protein YceK
MRRRLRGVGASALLVVAVLLSGCAAIPSSGAVNPGNDATVEAR